MDKSDLVENREYLTKSAISAAISDRVKADNKGILQPDQLACSVGGPHELNQHLSSLLKQGPSLIELAPGKYSIESMSLQVQQEIKERAYAAGAKVISVHVPPSQLSNLSGYDNRSFFSSQMQEHQKNEVEKAIELMANVGNGGAIVVHTGEFPRPVADSFKEFELYPEESKDSLEFLVDSRGKMFGVRADDKIFVPEYKKDNHGNIIYSQTIDKSGKLKDIEDSFGNKVPLLDLDESGSIKFTSPITLNQFYQGASKHLTGKMYKNREEAALNFYKYAQRLEIEKAIASAQENSQRLTELYSLREKLNSAYKFWLKQEKTMSKEELSAYTQHINYDKFLPPDKKKPSEYIETLIKENQSKITYHENLAILNNSIAKENIEKLNEIKTVKDFALEKSIKNIAECALKAIYATKQKQQKNKDFKPIFISPENIFPEMGFGSHPQELKELVQESRKYLSNSLLEKNIVTSKKEAEEIAATHIKATLDIEHLGMWKRFFKSIPGETLEEKDKRFNEWMLNQIEDLVKSGIIGHVHIADGFGYGHANLPAGQGNMPIKQALDIIKKYDKDKSITFLSEGYGDEPNQWIGAIKELTTQKIGEYEISFKKLSQYYHMINAPSYSTQAYLPILSNSSWIEGLPLIQKNHDSNKYNQ